MTIINSLARQPTAQDYASPTQFKFSIIKLPKVEYFCTAVNIPGISLGSVRQPTPFRDIPLPGDSITYDTLTMTFMVDENLENYQEIFGWLSGLGFPTDNKQYRDLLRAGGDRFPTSSGANLSTDPGKVKYGATSQGAVYSDATLTILTSKNNPVTEVRFTDIYPVSLSGLNYTQQATDVDYLTATVSFQYRQYEFASAGGSRTTTVTS